MPQGTGRAIRWVPCAALVLSACSSPQPPRDAASTAPPANAVVVRISYGSEKKAFLEDSIAAFQRTSPKGSSGRPIRIEAVAEGSAESMEAILAGQSTASVWSPASSFLIDVLNDRWAEAHPGLGANDKLVAEAPSLMLSPVVIAVWEPMARALGWPGKALGWSDVAQFATQAEGWSRFGHAEWGDFKLGHTHPRYSNSGAIALVAATYAGAGKTRDLSAEDVARAAPFVKRVQANIVHYGRSTGFFSDKMFTRGPAYLSAAVLYENLVAESRLDSKYANMPFPVVALYPKEGTFWADHPYAILNLPSVSAEVRDGAERFRQFLLGAERQRTALSRFGFRPVDTSIPLGAPIDAAHGLDPAQPKNVLPNPAPAVTRRILDSFESVKRPVAITFVLDISGSMSGDPLAQAKAGARAFLQGLPANDVVRILIFSTKPSWLVPDHEEISRGRDRLLAAIDGVFAQGDTALYDAIVMACQPSGKEPKGAIRTVIVLTDGQDTSSQAKLQTLLAQLAQQSGGGEGSAGQGTRIFTIAYGQKADVPTLKQIAEAGGGASFAGTPKDIKAVYAELASFF
jgi:Ca-activated chloride channel family protein